MTLLIETNVPAWMTNEALYQQLKPLLPAVDIRYGAELGNREEIVMLACVRLPAGLARTLPNLQLVQKLGAGVEAIVYDPDLPEDVAVARLKPVAPAQEIVEYCLAHVLRLQRNMPFHEANQRQASWQPIGPKISAQTTIGVLGLGHIGGRVATTFATLGFPVLGWSRSEKELAGVDCRVGEDGLAEIVGSADYLISVLPATKQTHHLFNDHLLSLAKHGMTLINVGRGTAVDEAALLRALARGQVGHAILDVFEQEPLPASHPFWAHPNVTVTPHVSGWHVGGGFEVVAENYRRLVAGEPILNVVDRAAGY